MTAADALGKTARRAVDAVRAERGLALLAVLAIAAAGLAVGLWATQYRADSRVGEAAARSVTEAASTGTVALLSYAPETVDADLEAAKVHLTGDFLAYYSQFTQQIVAPAAKEKSVSTDAAVVRSALAELTEDRALVLVFINQTTTSAEKPDPATTASSVRVTLTKVDDSWLISRFEPV